ncbi:D-Ala-D-Ala carboxypeptidase family metallohydrolase [Photobacterium swingsii]|uniref:D-Ala-D-Ala carboxypeptidase family metallohydrolase n=1 Tax=Photobacterium swingsii TaxID=680026 RepID=UPI003D102690
MYKLQHFKPQELVSKSTYNARGSKSIELMDERILITLDQLRINLGRPITVNNWIWNGQFQQRGLRTQEAKEYSKYSQHTFGRAVDFDVKGMSASEVRAHILTNINLYPFISFVEVGINWVHVDVRNCDLTCWHPKRGVLSVEQVLSEQL